MNASRDRQSISFPDALVGPGRYCRPTQSPSVMPGLSRQVDVLGGWDGQATSWVFFTNHRGEQLGSDLVSCFSEMNCMDFSVCAPGLQEVGGG